MQDNTGLAFLWLLLGALVGGIIFACTFISFGVSTDSLKEITVSYSDFLSASLTAVTIVLAVLAIIVSIAAILGYAKIKGYAQKAASKHVQKLIEDGAFDEVIRDSVVKYTTTPDFRSIIADSLQIAGIKDAELRASGLSSSGDEEYFER